MGGISPGWSLPAQFEEHGEVTGRIYHVLGGKRRRGNGEGYTNLVEGYALLSARRLFALPDVCLSR
jgi:hypothetical protein